MGTQQPARPQQRSRGLARRERELAALANRQHGIVTRRQLLRAGLGVRTIKRRVEAGRLHHLHRGVYVLGHGGLNKHGHWLGAVLACGREALLSHRSAAALLGLTRAPRGVVEVTSASGRRRPGIVVHQGGIDESDRTLVDAIPVTSVARTLLDLAEVVDGQTLRRAFEEADRLHLLEMSELEELCARSHGRRGLRALRPLIEAAREPITTDSPLEDRFAVFCEKHCLPPPATNVAVLGHEVDALWPTRRLMVEMDSYAYHRHRAAFERDRARDAEFAAAGYRVIRLTHRRLEEEPDAVADQLRRLLDPGAERGQGTVEWIGLLLLTSLVFLSLVATGVRFPGLSVAQAVASRILCAATIADSCGDEPTLIAAYGSEVGAIVREEMPSLAFEHGSRGLPVDFRSCRDTSCGDGPDSGLVVRSDAGRPVTAFVHVIDCREGGGRPVGADCSGEGAGNLYVQFWTYYADSATLRGVPIAGAQGFHRDDWESVQLRISPDGEVAERASSHHGYNYAKGPANAGSDAGIGALRDIAETVGARPHNGWGPASGLLFVSGGSHAGNVDAFTSIDRLAPGSRVHLVPLEPIAAETDTRFAISPPWRKQVWLDPEASSTD